MAAKRQTTTRSPHLRRRGPLSPLTLRILAINALAPVLLVVGLFYLDQYRAGLIDARIAGLITQGELIAGALGESALAPDTDTPTLEPERARQILRRLIAATETRARLFDEGGELAADSRILAAAGRQVVTRVLPPPQPPSPARRMAEWLYNHVLALLPPDGELPAYRERPDQRAGDYGEVVLALGGNVAWGVRRAGEDTIISVAVPVQSLRKVLGALMLSTDSREIDERVRAERLNVLMLFALVLGVTVLLSLFLAAAIVRPLRRLALAADRVRRTDGRRAAIPDFTGRRDEIGDLSGSLGEMTAALYRRLDAIEAFAADVAHELKNPLTSLRSAVETTVRTDDPEKRQRLMQIIADDVRRLDRLISDISDASRLDAELSRSETEPVDMVRLLSAVVDLYRDTARPGAPAIELVAGEGRELRVAGLQSRLGQVIRNLVDNALSFSPPGGRIRIIARRSGANVRIAVEDDGPGFPEDKLEAVFQRFYSERPAGERFGTHSGLGLSISQQIVEAQGGRIHAENRRDASGRVLGARLVVELPAL